MIDKKVMERLRKEIGKKVRVHHVWCGVPQRDDGLLRKVIDFVSIEIEGLEMPFIGCGSAIRKIVREDGEILYENPLIPINYDFRTFGEISRIVVQSFGEKIATERRQKIEAEYKGWEGEVSSRRGS